MTEYRYTTADLCEEFGLERKALRRRAAALHLGIDRGGRRGFLYSEEDRRKLVESMKPKPAVKPKRNRRRAA